MRISVLSFLIVLVACTILVYRMGAWRRTVVNTTRIIAAEVKVTHQETLERLSELERHLEAIDQCICISADYQEISSRRYHRLHRLLARIEQGHERLA